MIRNIYDNITIKFEAWVKFGLEVKSPPGFNNQPTTFQSHNESSDSRIATPTVVEYSYADDSDLLSKALMDLQLKF